MLSMWISSCTKLDLSKTFAKYYQKINKPRKALLGLVPHTEGTMWSRVSYRAFPFGYSHESRSELFSWHTGHQSETPLSNRVWSQMTGTALLQHPRPILMSLQMSPLRSLAQTSTPGLWKSFHSILQKLIHCICLYLTFWALFIILSLRNQYSQRKRAHTVVLSTLTASSCTKLNEAPFKNTDILTTFLCIFFSRSPSVSRWQTTQDDSLQWETHP